MECSEPRNERSAPAGDPQPVPSGARAPRRRRACVNRERARQAPEVATPPTSAADLLQLERRG